MYCALLTVKASVKEDQTSVCVLRGFLLVHVHGEGVISVLELCYEGKHCVTSV